jgi:hypothetical protein
VTPHFAEGALAKSLYFQFEDHAIPVSAAIRLVMEKMRELGDTRFIKTLSDLWNNVMQADSQACRLDTLANFVLLQLTNLQTLGKVPEDGAQRRVWMVMKLQALQAAVYFRSVSHLPDEPLCIANLLSLDVDRILLEDTREKRMACVWKLWTDASGGFPPAGIFLTDDPLPVPGWRWAPASLLGSGLSTAMSYDDALSRLKAAIGSQRLGTVVENLGLKVQLPGRHVTIKSWRKGGPIRLWDWPPVASKEHILMCRHTSSGKWYQMQDQKRGVARDNLGPAEMEIWDRQNPHPLREGLLSGSDMVLIQDTVVSRNGPTLHLLAEILGPIPKTSPSSMSPAEGVNPSELHVHGRRTVTLVKLDDSWTSGLNHLRDIAIDIAQDGAMTDLLSCSERTSQEHIAAAAKLGAYMDSRMAQARDFEKFCRDNLPAARGSSNLVPLILPYDVELSDIQDNQSWVVDRA